MALLAIESIFIVIFSAKPLFLLEFVKPRPMGGGKKVLRKDLPGALS
jgi:hypothetical protein